MSKILIEGNKVIIDGHANDLETCNTLTNLCDELSTSDKFRTVRYESGYGEFESISENKEKKFIDIPLPPPPIPFNIYSNNGTTLYYSGDIQEMDLMEVTSTGMSINGSSVYTYSGNKVFLGFSDKVNSTSATFPVGYTGTGINISASNELYIVEANPGVQVNIQSNDGTATLTQNATVNSVVVTSTGAQLKYGDTVNATYTYDGSKLFAGLATSANATAPKYKPGDTIEITAATTFYIVENIIIPEHHSSLTELFTNIASVIREKTGDTASIVADEFPSVIRSNLRPSQFEPDGASYLTFSSPNSFTLKVNDTTKHWDGTLEYFDLDRTWAVWDGTTTLSSVDNYGKHVLYLRGTGNKMITGSDDYKWVLTGSDISCIGNIEYLLDYATVESGVNPTMAGNCYKSMFQGCTALTKAPDLPATTLKSDCYSYMFYYCTSLIQAPALPATTLADYCYQSMFQGCTRLKFSTTYTGEYTIAYRIPSSGTGTTASDALSDMLYGTGGTFKGTPKINTTYYLSNTNQVISPPPVMLISFTIDGTTYQAEEGMTVGQWLGSSYNTGGFSKLYDPSGAVSNDSIVQPNYHYFSRSGGTPGN